jgi:hypothetical protein
MLQHPAAIAVDQAARILDCTVRTIWRNLQLPQEAALAGTLLDECFRFGSLTTQLPPAALPTAAELDD